jgi:hypothetical protein
LRLIKLGLALTDSRYLNVGDTIFAIMEDSENRTIKRVAETIQNYGRRGTRYRILYLLLKASQIAMAATIPVLNAVSWFGVHKVLISALGASVVVAEGLLQTFEFQKYWIRYRHGQLALGREKFLFEAQAGSYRGVSEPQVLFAERAENIIAATQASWLLALEQTTGITDGKKSS